MDRLRSECVRCILEKQMASCPQDVPEAQKLHYLQRMLCIVGQAPATLSAPLLLRDISRLRDEMFGHVDEFGPIKRHFNQVMLDQLPRAEQEIGRARDPLPEALRLALAGNYIDFGAMKDVSEERLRQMLAAPIPLDAGTVQRFRRDLGQAEHLLFLTDNCGEVVMDKLLIRVIRQLWPRLEVTVMVRGGPVLNDATWEDARQVGLEEVARVIDSGTALAGTCAEELTGPALEAWQQADVVLAKGQGNFETLRGCGRNVYYLFLCKCRMFADAFGVQPLTGMFLNDDSL